MKTAKGKCWYYSDLVSLTDDQSWFLDYPLTENLQPDNEVKEICSEMDRCSSHILTTQPTLNKAPSPMSQNIVGGTV